MKKNIYIYISSNSHPSHWASTFTWTHGPPETLVHHPGMPKGYLVDQVRTRKARAKMWIHEDLGCDTIFLQEMIKKLSISGTFGEPLAQDSLSAVMTFSLDIQYLQRGRPWTGTPFSSSSIWGTSPFSSNIESTDFKDQTSISSNTDLLCCTAENKLPFFCQTAFPSSDPYHLSITNYSVAF